MNTCRLTTRKKAAAEGYKQFTGQIDRGTLAGKRILERILHDARQAGRDHVCVQESLWTVTVWEKGYIEVDGDYSANEAEKARRDLLNATEIGYRGISYVH